MKTTHKQVLALLLAVALLLLLCACAQIQQLKGSDSATLPETLAGQASEMQSEDPTQHSEITEPQQAQHSEATEPQQAQYIGSEEGKNSLLRLRDKIDFSQTMFGMAYLGYVGGLFEDGFEAGFSGWLWETNEAMLLKYPFIAEIDEEHIIGGAGHLYCIVPVDENATLAINRVQWNAQTQQEEVTEVLYRSETGKPVLLLANLDGVAYEADTQLFITDSNNTYEWYPGLNAESRLALALSYDYHIWDFTEYTWQYAPPSLAQWLADGWGGVTALSLAGSESYGMGWFYQTMVGQTDRVAYFSLRFYHDDESGGSVDLEWTYEGSSDIEEMWSGFWTIESVMDGPSYVTLSLSLVGGNSYETTDGPFYMSETYPLLISPSGTELMIGAGENGICLPFMSQSTTACVLTQAVG